MANKWLSKLTADFGAVAAQLNKNLFPVVPSRSPSLNWATDIGGFQPGKVVVAYGPESSGKSLLAMMAIADYQRRDPEAIFIWFDAEFSFNLALFLKVGGDPERLIVRRSNDPLKIFDYIGGEMLELLQEGCPIRGMVIDSIKAIRYPKETNMKQTTDQKMGGTGASYLPTALKLVIPVVAEYQLMTFFIQQVTMEIDPMKALRNPFVITEGRALKHAADLMLEIVKLDTKKGVIEMGKNLAGSDHQVGHIVRVKVKKNRLGVPARMGQFTWHYTRGVVDTENEIYELGKSLDILYHPISKNTGKADNSMWKLADYEAIKGEDNFRQWICSSPELLNEIMQAAYKHQDAAVELDETGTVVESAVDEIINLDNEG
jgi:recombination protein RecA